MVHYLLKCNICFSFDVFFQKLVCSFSLRHLSIIQIVTFTFRRWSYHTLSYSSISWTKNVLYSIMRILHFQWLSTVPFNINMFFIPSLQTLPVSDLVLHFLAIRVSSPRITITAIVTPSPPLPFNPSYPSPFSSPLNSSNSPFLTFLFRSSTFTHYVQFTSYNSRHNYCEEQMFCWIIWTVSVRMAVCISYLCEL